MEDVIPNWRIEDRKVRDYLLSSSHPVGRFKARFFNSLGYQEENWRELKNALLHLGSNGTQHAAGLSVHGRKFLVSGTLSGPSGKSAQVVTVWIVPHDSDSARLVTAMPGGKKWR